MRDAIKDIKSKKKTRDGQRAHRRQHVGGRQKLRTDIPIDPRRRRHYNFNYDMHHDYSGISSPAHFGSITPHPLYKTVRTSDVPVTFWNVPLGSESLLVHRLLKSPPASNELYPTPIPSYWRPTYVNGGSHNQGARGPNNRYPGVYRSVVHKRPFQPTPSPSPGFYGGVHPRVYPQPPGPTSGVWCPPRSPGWPSSRPVYPTSTSTTSTRPVLNVKDKLDLDDAEEDDKGEDVKKTPPGDVKIIGKVGLDDFRK
ncbi:Protein of unknown function [Gryllus bimaculatus]|nr:Protein of unknown function [Gryllus bimaculatus]